MRVRLFLVAPLLFLCTVAARTSPLAPTTYAYPRADGKIVAFALDKTGTRARLTTPPYQLSGGEANYTFAVAPTK